MLLRDSNFSNVDLTKVHFWWGDERFVSKSSKDRNSNQANQALLDHIHIPISNIHEFPASDSGLSLFDARERFEEILGAFFAGDEPKMDITILGMGPDGHVASLFPGFTPDGSHVVAVENSPKPPSERLSFGIELINRSAKIIFVVSGLDKAEAVFSVLKNPACEFPAAQVRASGETIWFIDEAAGSEFWGC
jgi:6-phosphogluconolactonase